jgi:amidase
MIGEHSRRDVLIGAVAAAGSMTMNSASFAQSGATSSGLAYGNLRELAAALAGRQVSAVELFDQTVARIVNLDVKLNAVVVRDFDRARAAATQADAALARGERRPLLGIPMTVKESLNVAGLPTTWGIPAAKGWQPAEDAVTIARLKAAGAVILGKTNVPLLLADWQSYNDVYGTTNNPWDTGRTPGGSSGGSAASLAAGFVPLELGSDIAGSLRAPAHCCGVFAHKPTHSLVPSRGHAPPNSPALPREVDLAVIGPMARSATDLALALDVLAGPDAPLATAYRVALPPPRHADLKSFRVFVIDTHPLIPTARSVGAAIDRLAEQLARAGTRVARASPLLPDLAFLARLYEQLLYAFFGVDLPIEEYRRILSRAGGLSADTTDIEQIRTRALVSSHREWVQADRMREGLAARWRAFFRDWDVVVCPVLPTPAFPHDHSEQRTRTLDIDGTAYPYANQIVWAGLATLTGLPATAVPIARSEAGLPIGVQIIGPYLEDRTTIAFAEAIEREFGGFVAPPGFA